MGRHRGTGSPAFGQLAQGCVTGGPLLLAEQPHGLFGLGTGGGLAHQCHQQLQGPALFRCIPLQPGPGQGQLAREWQLGVLAQTGEGGLGVAQLGQGRRQLAALGGTGPSGAGFAAAFDLRLSPGPTGAPAGQMQGTSPGSRR